MNRLLGLLTYFSNLRITNNVFCEVARTQQCFGAKMLTFAVCMIHPLGTIIHRDQINRC